MVFLAYGWFRKKPYDLEHNHNICFILILNDLFSATYFEQSLTKTQTKALFQTINDFQSSSKMTFGQFRHGRSGP